MPIPIQGRRNPTNPKKMDNRPAVSSRRAFSYLSGHEPLGGREERNRGTRRRARVGQLRDIANGNAQAVKKKKNKEMKNRRLPARIQPSTRRGKFRRGIGSSSKKYLSFPSDAGSFNAATGELAGLRQPHLHHQPHLHRARRKASKEVSASDLSTWQPGAWPTASVGPRKNGAARGSPSPVLSKDGKKRSPINCGTGGRLEWPGQIFKHLLPLARN